MKKPRRLATRRGHRGRGRPRKPRLRADNGTPESQARKRELANGGDTARVSCPMDIYHLRGLISDQQHRAGKRYAALFGAFVGRTSPKSCLADPTSGSAGRGEDHQAKMEAQYRKLAALLRPKAKSLVDLVCVFHRPIPASEWVAAIPRLRDSLDLIASATGLGKSGRQTLGCRIQGRAGVSANRHPGRSEPAKLPEFPGGPSHLPAQHHPGPADAPSTSTPS